MLAARRMMIDRARKVTPNPVPATLLTSWSDANVTSTTSGSFLPTADALIIVAAAIYDGSVTSPTITASDTLGGLTWTETTTGWHTDANFNVYKTSIFTAFAPSSPSAGTVTLTSTSAHQWFKMTVLEAPGVNVTTPIAQSANALVQATTGDGTTTHTLTATLGSAPTGTVLAVLGQHYVNGGGVAPTDDPDFTNLAYSTGTTGSVEQDLDVSYADGGSRTSCQWSGLTEGAVGFAWWFYGLIVELNP